jgi:hypothetical protein
MRMWVGNEIKALLEVRKVTNKRDIVKQLMEDFGLLR